jgi:Flp pilus assembly protein TadG
MDGTTTMTTTGTTTTTMTMTMMTTMTDRGSAAAIDRRRFRRDERGGFTLVILMLFSAALMICGIAIDGGFAYLSRTALQGTADAAAAAAVSALPDEDAARDRALDYVERNMPARAFGTLAGPEDVTVGRWDQETGAFHPGEEPANAVSVVLGRLAGRGNAVPTFFLPLVGVDGWDLRAASTAVVIASGRECARGGFFSARGVETRNAGRYAPGTCLHGQQGVEVGNANRFEEGSIASARSEGRVRGGRNNRGLGEARAGLDLDLPLPERVRGIVRDLSGGRLGGLMGRYRRVERIEEIDRRTRLRPGTLYVVEDEVELGSGLRLEDVAIVTREDIEMGSNVRLRNVVLATTGGIEGRSNIRIRSDDACATGYFGSYLFAGDGIEFGSRVVLEGVQIASGGEIEMRNRVTGFGVHAEAAGEIELGNRVTLDGCAGGLASLIRDGVDGVRVAGGAGSAGRSMLVR